MTSSDGDRHGDVYFYEYSMGKLDTDTYIDQYLKQQKKDAWKNCVVDCRVIAVLQRSDSTEEVHEKASGEFLSSIPRHEKADFQGNESSGKSWETVQGCEVVT